MFGWRSSLCFFTAVLPTAFAVAGTSELYGARGEQWDSNGRLPDFSYAGFEGEGAPLPEVSVVASVAEFGALGDGVTDDTEAIQAAIDATNNGALLFPSGQYRITKPLYISKSDLVLRGMGRDETEIFVDASLEEVLGANQVWSWNGGFIWVRPTEAPQVLATVQQSALRGDHSLIVDEAGALSAGQRIVLSLRDDTGALGMAMHNGLADAGTCDWQKPLTHDWPVTVTAVAGTEVTLSQPLRLPLDMSWSPRVLSAPFVTRVGIESMTVSFPETEYAGHLNEPGYNAIFFEGGVADSWVKEVRIVHSDNGVLFDRLSKNLTVDDLILSGRVGHHGLNIAFTADSLFSSIHWEADFIHDFTFDHRSSGNVVERATSAGLRLSLDHHRDGSHENLFTEFFAETDFWSGGSQCAGPAAGARQTFWNMDSGFLKPPWARIQANIVGDTASEAVFTDEEEWIEPVSDLVPINLYREQRAQRLGMTSTVPDAPTTPEANGNGCGCVSVSGIGSIWVFVPVVLWRMRREHA